MRSPASARTQANAMRSQTDYAAKGDLTSKAFVDAFARTLSPSKN
jgi:hypothetical protein